MAPPVNTPKLPETERRDSWRFPRWRWWLHPWRLLVYMLAVPVLWYLRLALAVSLGTPGLTRDYVAEVNAATDLIPLEKRAWPLFADAAALLDVPKGIAAPRPGDWIGAIEYCRPGYQEWPAIAAFLEANRPAIEAARDAAARERLGATLSTIGARTMVPATALAQQLGTVSWWSPTSDSSLAGWDDASVLVGQWCDIVSADMAHAASNGDTDRVLADIEALSDLLRQMYDCPGVDGRLWRWSLRRDRLLETLDWSVFRLLDGESVADDASLRRALAGLAAFDPDAAWERSVEHARRRVAVWSAGNFNEPGIGMHLITRKGFGEWLQCDAYTQGSAFSIAVHAVGRAGWPVIAGALPSRSGFLTLFDRRVEEERSRATVGHALRTPDWHADPLRVRQAMKDAGTIESLRHLPLLADLVLAEVIPERTGEIELWVMRRDALVVAIALELFRRDHGSWPDRLQDLVPAYLERVPTDRISGKSFGYTLRNGEPLVYSVGADRDDDGGQLPGHAQVDPRTANRYASEWLERTEYDEMRAKLFWDSRYNGDWILWPKP